MSQERIAVVATRADAPRLGSIRRPTLHDSMPYMWAVVYELLRYVTVVPLANRLTLEDTTIAGHRLPAGTVVMVHYWAMHHDSDFWGDPEVFRPERFLDPASGQLLCNDYRRFGEEVVLLDIGSGRELARVRVGGIMQGVVFPGLGWNDDAYWCSMGRLARVFAA